MRTATILLVEAEKYIVILEAKMIVIVEDLGEQGSDAIVRLILGWYSLLLGET